MTPLVHAWRALARRPAFACLTVLMLAAGIAASTTMFSIVDGVLLRSLPYPDAGQLVAIYEASPGRRERVSLAAPARLEDWSRMSRTFVAISGSYAENVTDTSGAEPARLDGRRVLPGFFGVFGMPALAGRTFVDEEERFGGRAAAVVSERFWTRRFSRSESAIGAELVVGGVGYTIVGVMPAAFAPSATTDVWIPAHVSPGLMRVRTARFISGVGRISPGVTQAAARADLERVQQMLGEQFPSSDGGWSADLRDLKDARVSEYRRPLTLVFGAIALLFAIAVANVAGLVLVHLHRRAVEFAIRTAIGASRARVVAGVMHEMSLLAAAGAALGAAGAFGLTRAARTAFAELPRMAEIGVDRRALLFAILSSAGGALVFGLVPAIAASRAKVGSLLASGGRAVSGRHALQRAIVAAQIALGVVLAGTAGLLVRSYGAMSGVDLGFEPSGVLTFHVGAAWDEDRARVAQFQGRLLTELPRLPGVRAAGFSNFLPASGATLRSQIRVDGLTGPEPSGAVTVGTRTVTPHYLSALGVPLASGRWCGDVPRAGDASRPREALVNRAFVARHASGQNLLDRSFTFVQQGSGAFRIAGVVEDVREDSPAMPPVPYIYVCLSFGAWPDPNYVVRADGDMRALVSSIRAITRQADPARPVFGVKPLTAVIDAALDQPRLNATALGVFAAAALVLAALGLYSLMTLLVAQRRREIGVRIALGAAPREIVALMLAGAGRLVGAGVAIGLVMTLAAGRVLQSMLFGVGPYDPAALAGAVLALAVAGFAALILPGRQAARVSPLDALRD